MSILDPQIAITLGVLAAVLVALVFELLSADVAMLGGLGVVVVAGVIPLDQALSGFANPTLVALGSLFVVSAALESTGALAAAARLLLGGTARLRVLLARMVVPVSIGSAFLNNTPIVAMGIPAIQTWAERHELSASKLLMPLSYAAIFGGMCTLMGTSTNLVVHGMLQERGLAGFDFFELAWVGVPCTIVGWLYLVFIGPWLTPDHETPSARHARTPTEPAHEVVEVELVDHAEVAGRTIADAGLDKLPGLRINRIERDGAILAPVVDDAVLCGGDRLFYAPANLAEDREFDGEDVGLRLKVSSAEELSDRTPPGRRKFTVVVRTGSRLAGQRLRDSNLLRGHEVTVDEVRRGGRSIDQPVGDIVLREGDTLVLDAAEDLRGVLNDAPEFHVTSSYSASEQAQAAHQASGDKRRMWFTLAVLVGIVGLTAAGVFSIALSALLGALVLLVAGIISAPRAREAIDWQVLVVIGAALGLSEAMTASGAAELVGSAILEATRSLGPYGVLAGVIVGTSVLTELITNNGAVALFFPIAFSVGESMGIDPMPLIVGMTVAGSMSMATPLGYQTNLMVYSAGDYRFVDFPRAGIPLQLALMTVAVAVIPFFWSF